jgi:hypothetical protein
LNSTPYITVSYKIYLAYCYSVGLSENEAAEVDQLISRNRAAIYISVRNLPSNVNRKVKRVIVVIALRSLFAKHLPPNCTSVTIKYRLV